MSEQKEQKVNEELPKDMAEEQPAEGTVEQPENKEQPADGGPAQQEIPAPHSYNYDQAMAMLKAGKTMQLADNGKGLMLPGVLHVIEPKNLIQLATATVLAPGLQVAALQLLFLNIMPIGGNQVCLRFYTPDDFDKNSLWIDVSETVVEPNQAPQTKAEVIDENGGEAEGEQKSNVRPLFPGAGEQK